MLYLPVTREKLLHLTPKGGAVAEIVTYRGDFAAGILKTARPDHLHLIDPWISQKQPYGLSKDGSLSGGEHQGNLDYVKQRFNEAIGEDRVHVHRDYSETACRDFPNRPYKVKSVNFPDGTLRQYPSF